MPEKELQEAREPVTVLMVFRKRVAHFFSIEKIFFQVAELLEKQLDIKKAFVPEYTSSIGAALKNIRWMRKQKADIYHVTGDIHYAVLGCPRKKTILTIHDCVFMYQTKGLKRLVMHRLFLKWPVRYCRLVTTISEQSRRDIIKFTGCAPSKVVVIPNPSGQIFKYRERTFNKQRPIFLFVGTTQNKNLVRAAEALSGISCVLDIIGPVPEEQARLMDRLQLTWRQSSKLTEEQLVMKYAEADALLFPTTFEGFGLPILEAQLTGLPVITSNLSPMKDVAGEGACLVDPYNVESIREGVLRVMNEPGYRDSLINRGLENSRLYSPEKIAGKYLDQYMTILDREK
jgi:glycosyltransferase involved in cell wall biosynthesis